MTVPSPKKNSLCEALRLIRVYHGIKQTQLALELGIAGSYVSQIESGQKIPTLDVIIRYSQRFDIPASSILFFAENKLRGCGIEKARDIISNKIIILLNWISTLDGAE